MSSCSGLPVYNYIGGPTVCKWINNTHLTPCLWCLLFWCCCQCMNIGGPTVCKWILIILTSLLVCDVQLFWRCCQCINTTHLTPPFVIFQLLLVRHSVLCQAMRWTSAAGLEGRVLRMTGAVRLIGSAPAPAGAGMERRRGTQTPYSSMASA